MDAGKIFISHTSSDDAIVAEIRKALEGHGLPTWADSRELTASDDLNGRILEKIERACWEQAAFRPGGCARTS